MLKRLLPVLALVALATLAQTALPVIVIHPFTAKKGIDWPYDFGKLQKATVTKVQDKVKQRAQVVAAAPASGAAPVYTLDGQIVRMFQRNNLDNTSGGVASNDDIITVHYWLTNAQGRKLFDKTTTYTSPSTGSYSDALFGTPGPMAGDLESDIANHIKDAKAIFSGR